MLMTRPRLAFCFFGITRSLSFTQPSIVQNLLTPARAMADVTVHAHFFDQTHIDNPRSGEIGALPQGEAALLAPDFLETEPPDNCLQVWNYGDLKDYGDYWNTGFSNLRNLVHQLHSLDRVTQSALNSGADIVLFARPDLTYHDSLAPALTQAFRPGAPHIWTPYWQRWKGGLNDRFALARGEAAISAWGQRARLMHEFCGRLNAPLQAEQLVRYALWRDQIAFSKLDLRATRTRLDGSKAEEDFATRPFRVYRQWGKLRRRFNETTQAH